MMPFDLPAMRAMHFGQHMQPIERVATETVEEIRMLEAQFAGDLKCEAIDHQYGSCTVEATHLLHDCEGNGVICTVAAAYVQHAIDAGLKCLCGEPTTGHVWLVPL